MEELSLDNILEADEVESLFATEESLTELGSTSSEEDDSNDKNKKTTEVNAEELFVEPESVGSGDNTEGKKGAPPAKETASSSNNFYSSIAKALLEEGIFSDLTDDDINAATDPEGFRDLVDRQIKAGLDDRQKRIDEALGVGVEPTEIRKYENTIAYLESIKTESITAESPEGENLRKQLIYQDFINRGYSKERANREVQKSLNGGTDVEDAKEALISNKEFFTNAYKDLVDDAKAEEAKVVEERKKLAEALKTSILSDAKVFGDVEVDKSTRLKVFDNISKPIYKDPETGDYYTAIQKYEMEHRTDFLKNVGLLFTLTDGFKNLDGLIKGKVRKEVNKGLRDLEKTINNTARTSDGNLKFVSGVNEDTESMIGHGWKLDI